LVGLAWIGGCREATTSTGAAMSPAAMSGSGAATPISGAPAAPSGTSAGAYLGAGGIGVSDMAKSFDFYTNVMGMTQRYELMVPNYAYEKILYFKDSKGSDVVLMNFTDGKMHNYAKNPVKLVFYVPSASTLIEAIRARGLQILAEPSAQAAFGNTVIGFARDPDGYILEIIESPGLTVPYLGAIGIGVADLEKAKDFYTRVLGMQTMGNLISVPNVWDEWILQYPSGKGSSLVILHYTDGSTRNYLNNPIKTVHFVPDSRALTESVQREGLPILSQPTMYNVQGVNALIGLARDPDGYQLEMVTTQ
jgi:catechol 2,3-dioxygenase-like lactoylglutathione lyase family enzyme